MIPMEFGDSSEGLAGSSTRASSGVTRANYPNRNGSGAGAGGGFDHPNHGAHITSKHRQSFSLINNITITLIMTVSIASNVIPILTIIIMIILITIANNKIEEN